MSVRKHLYLITEHEDDDRVGGISVTDHRLSRGRKNAETPITALNKEKEGFEQIGKQVHLGYLEFPDESAYEQADPSGLADLMQAKVREVDRRWASKAGIEDVIYENTEEGAE